MFDLRFQSIAALAALVAVTAAVAMGAFILDALPSTDSGSNSGGDSAGLTGSDWLGR